MLQAEVDNNQIQQDFCLMVFQEHFLDVFFSFKRKYYSTIALEADDEILVARLLDRGKTSGRADDQDEEN
jgi:adenylate kinase